MSDAISNANTDAGVPGVTVAVLREALDLMEIQGQAVVTMIESAPGSVSAAAQAALSDPMLAQNVDLLA